MNSIIIKMNQAFVFGIFINSKIKDLLVEAEAALKRLLSSSADYM